MKAGFSVVRTGAQLAADNAWSMFAEERVAVLANQASLLPGFVHIVDDMVAHGATVVAILGPEHGFRGSAPEGSSEATTRDPRLGVPVVDCYRFEAPEFAQTLKDAQATCLVVDLQDVGVRFYTYIWTLYRALAGAGLSDVRVVVLDRPNPLGRRVRGPGVEPGFTSEIGLRNIPLCHGRTLGELAVWFVAEFLPADETPAPALDVVGVEGWDGGRWPTTGLPWVPPSPNLPTVSSALLYPGTGLLEAVNLSEGRGTARPFEVAGAPWVDHRFAETLRAAELPGVAFAECQLTPTAGKYQGESISAVQIHVLDADLLDPLAVGAHLLCAARDLYSESAGDGSRAPARFSDRGDDWRWLGLMTGSNRARDLLVAGAPAGELAAWLSG